MTVYYKYNERYITIVGKTYSYREVIKKLGGQFVANRKSWMIPVTTNALSQVEKICKSSGGGLLDQPLELSLPITGKANDLKKEPGITKPLPATPEKRSFSITELVRQVEDIVVRKFPVALWVTGEVQTINKRGGHLYITLADGANHQPFSDTIAVNGTLWSSTFQKISDKHGKEPLQEVLQEGLKVCFLCQIQFYKARSSLSLNILDVDLRHTKGALALQREETLRYLKKKGADQKNKQFKLTPFPLTIGLISAPHSRAYGDFTNQLQQANFPGKIFFAAASMQGKNLVSEITQALLLLKEKSCDLVVITRGGGSSSDLRWFDSLELALEVSQYPSPILAAIGHHDDVSILEMIAFEHIKTPTAAAEYLIHRLKDTRDRIRDYHQALINNLLKTKEKEEEKLHEAWERFSLTTLNKLQRSEQTIFSLYHGLGLSSKTYATRKEQRLSSLGTEIERLSSYKINEQDKKQVQFARILEQKIFHQISDLEKNYLSNMASLKSSDPRPWLKKGWTQLEKNGKKISTIQRLKTRDTLRAKLIDGSLIVEIKTIEGQPSREKPL